jgi:polar amino acid transport system substrate-binding protein
MLSSQILFIIIAILSIGVLILLTILYKKSKLENGLNRKIKILERSSEYSEDGLLVITNEQELITFNDMAKQLFVLYNKELAKAVILKMSDGKMESINSIIKANRDRLEHFKSFSIEATLLKKRKEISVRISFEAYFMSEKSSEYDIIVIIQDISQELLVTKHRHRDLLTNLPNQSQAMLDIGMFMNKMNTTGKKFGLVLLGIDHFSDIRAILGHRSTDLLIGKIVESLRYFAREIDSSVYQMTRNNFLLLIPDITLEDEVKKIIKTIRDDLSTLLDSEVTHVDLTFSTGVSFFPISGNGIDMLIDNAYKALAKAEEKGNGHIVIDYEMSLDRTNNSELYLFSQMNSAIKDNQFELYYQPYIDMNSGAIQGAEALLRWKHPEKGLISPMEFIPLAEKTGFIIELGKFVVEEAIKQQKKWELFEFHELPIAINLSLREIETGDMVEFVNNLLSKYQINPALIKFEITESVGMVNTEVAKKEFLALKKLGVSLALDDFGTGYASFSYLRDFPLDTLKIDLAFVANIVENQEHQKIVKAMVNLGHNFGLKVIAKGIEDKATHDLIQSYKCDMAQGYYFSKPLPVFEFQELIRKEL